MKKIFGKEDEDLIGGHFTDTHIYFVDGILDENELYRNIEGNKYKALGFFNTSPDYNKNGEYKRTHIFILDAIADISSLTSIIFELFSFIFSHFYSKNFDNYKIIENILNNISKNNKEEEKEDDKESKNSNNKKDKKIKVIELVPVSRKSKDFTENIETENNNLETKTETKRGRHSLYEIKEIINDKIEQVKKKKKKE